MDVSPHTHTNTPTLRHTRTHTHGKEFYKQRFSLGSRQRFWRLIAATNKAVRYNNIQCLKRETFLKAMDWHIARSNVSTHFKRNLLNVSKTVLKGILHAWQPWMVGQMICTTSQKLCTTTHKAGLCFKCGKGKTLMGISKRIAKYPRLKGHKSSFNDQLNQTVKSISSMSDNKQN